MPGRRAQPPTLGEERGDRWVYRGRVPTSPHRVPSVTTARVPRSEDRSRRARQYFLAMTIRTVCFVAACVTATFTKGPLLWFFVVLAVVLPYIAVVIANATNYTIGSLDPAEPPVPGRQLPGSRIIAPLPGSEPSQE